MSNLFCLFLLYLLLRTPAAALLPIVFFLLVAAPAFAGETDYKWTYTDTAGQMLVTASLIGDWGQTAYAARHPKEFREQNPILGPYPHTDTVHAYFAACIVGHAAVSYLLPRKMELWGLPVYPRSLWQAVWFGIEVNAIRSNYAVGVQWRL